MTTFFGHFVNVKKISFKQLSGVRFEKHDHKNKCEASYILSPKPTR